MLYKSHSRLKRIMTNPHISVAVTGATMGLSLAQVMQWINGVLPTVSLLLSTLCMLGLLILHVQNGRKTALEIRKLKLDLEDRRAAKHG